MRSVRANYEHHTTKHSYRTVFSSCCVHIFEYLICIHLWTVPDHCNWARCTCTFAIICSIDIYIRAYTYLLFLVGTDCMTISVVHCIILLTYLYLIRPPQSFEWPAPRKSRLCGIISLQCLRCSANSSNLSNTMFCFPENTVLHSPLHSSSSSS